MNHPDVIRVLLADDHPIVCLGLVGVGNTLVDVSGFTLVQRSVPDEILARVFGVPGAHRCVCVLSAKFLWVHAGFLFLSFSNFLF